MKKLHFVLLCVLTALSVFTVSGCGGGGSNSGLPGRKPEPELNVVQVITINSPVIERNKRYRIYRGARLEGMNGARIFAANTGSEAVQSVMNLGFSEEILTGETFIIVNDSPDDAAHNGAVIFAYDPSGIKTEPLVGGSVSFSGGTQMRYRALSLTDTGAAEFAGAVMSGDAQVWERFSTERGTTTLAAGNGINLSFIEADEEYYLSRDVPLTGNVFRIVRRVNTFSGIIAE